MENKNKKKIVFFTGAGISAESGAATFRSGKDGLWNNHKIEDVASIEGWKKNKELVLNFYNDLRKQMKNLEPNKAHKGLAELEKDFDVTIITQNVDDFHERGGSTNILHLHGELNKARCSIYDNKESILDKVIDIGYNDINIGDKCSSTNSQLRPHIVWFGEFPFNVKEAYEAVSEADILVIVGTSLQISYTLDLLTSIKKGCRIVYIDPKPMHYLDNYGLTVEYITKKATEGVTQLVEELTKKVA